MTRTIGSNSNNPEYASDLNTSLDNLRLNQRKKIRHLPLWLQTGIALGTTILLVGFGAGEFVRTIETKYLYNELEEQTKRTVSLLSAVSLDAVISQDALFLETIVEQAVSKDPAIASIEIHDEEGQRLLYWQSHTNSQK